MLRLGRDYTVEYLDNVNAGTATAVIRGAGEYCGEAKLTFAITAPKGYSRNPFARSPWYRR